MPMSQKPSSNRSSFWLGVAAVGCLGTIMAGLSVDRESHRRHRADSTAPVKFLTNPPGIVDVTVRFEPFADFALTPENDEAVAPRSNHAARRSQGEETKSCRLVSDPAPNIELHDTHPRDFPREGVWTTRVVEAELPFTEFLPSWNATVPADCGVVFEARVRDHGKRTWSPWLYVGFWGHIPGGTHQEQFEGGKLDTDNLQLTSPCDAFQMRVKFESYSLDASKNPSLRRLQVIYSGVPAEEEKAKWIKPVAVAVGWDRNLPVPFRPQGDAPPSLSWQLCSPTSTSMVMNYWGVDRPTVENALAIYDVDHDMFGNWGRAVQYAGSMGLDAWLERFRNWDQVKAKIAMGQPVIASIRFGYGEFPSSVLTHSAGHLIVLRGFTKDGDVICNDPGSRAKGNGVVYKASELGHAWFDHGGVGYVIQGKAAMTTQPTTRPVVAGK